MRPDPNRKATDEPRLRIAVTDVSELAGLLDSIEASLDAVAVPGKLRNRCLLATEEIVVNALRHGREDPAEEVVVELSTSDEEIAVTVAYAGVAFDPSDPKSIPPLDLDRVGGDGLRLVHQMVDSIRYARHGSRNIVILLQRIGERG